MGRLLLLVSLFLCSACYRYELSPLAEERALLARKLHDSGKRTELCKLVTSEKSQIAESWNRAGDCQAGKDQKAAIESFQTAALCGSNEAAFALTQLGQLAPEPKYKEGEYSNFYLFFSEGPQQCGLAKYPTSLGWPLAPFGITLEMVSGVSAVAGGVVLIPAAMMVLPPVVYLTCATGAAVVCIPSDDYLQCLSKCGALFGK